jgi:hypothetical protein
LSRMRGLWRDVELFCPVCQEWRPTGAGTTQVSFKDEHGASELQKRVLLTCGHHVMAAENQSRIGLEI